jgi:hypothetical protein
MFDGANAFSHEVFLGVELKLIKKKGNLQRQTNCTQ